ncbi:UNVERIFIED_CONTAM: hypothetical protein NCL1_27765 [Trichonephila clavipes]
MVLHFTSINFNHNFLVYKYLNDKWLICRSPRATTTVSRAEAAEAASHHAEHLGEMLTALSVSTKTERRETREQRISEWVHSNFDSDSDS